jgi:hypothetical protein
VLTFLESAGGDGDGGVRRDDGTVGATAQPPQGQTAQPRPQAPQPVFRSRREVIPSTPSFGTKRAIARGLTADFEIREDGRPQEVLNFTFEEIRDNAPAKIETADLLAGVEARLRSRHVRPFCDGRARCRPLTSESMAGRRLIALLFDVSSMQPDDVQRAVDSARSASAKDERRRPRGGRHRQPTLSC